MYTRAVIYKGGLTSITARDHSMQFCAMCIQFEFRKIGQGISFKHQLVHPSKGFFVTYFCLPLFQFKCGMGWQFEAFSIIAAVDPQISLNIPIEEENSFYDSGPKKIPSKREALPLLIQFSINKIN